jgi:cellulose synthase/poly-beta-1,6-N-acetylglucosamine synthase-like glycosyltransferase/peptidoglycan/xylan/chitin deacetylase (PgdA/CDA1 family)
VTSLQLARRDRRRLLRVSGLRPYWIALSAIMAFLMLTLGVYAYTHRVAPPDGAATPGSSGTVPAEVVDGGPVVDAASGQIRTAAPRQGTVAITFDDGPDPEWTLRILDVLREHDVRATFFVLGTAVIDQPDLVRQIAEEGHEIGIHTLTHADLATLPAWQQSMELSVSQRVLMGAAGISTSLFRPPYSSTNAALSDGDWESVGAAAGAGYLSVLSTADSRDWTRPGVDQIVADSLATGPEGEILLMHDGGGDRSQTVEALDDILTTLDARGVEVTTVGDAVGIAGTNPAVSSMDAAVGATAITGFRLGEFIVTAMKWMLLVTGVIVLLRAVLVLAAAVLHVRRARRAQTEPLPVVVEPVSVIVPAYNEQAGIEAAVRSIAASTHPVEIIVVDDGSTDDTAGVVERLGLGMVRLIRQPNAGKPAALNAGLRAASHEVIVMVDGDTVFQPDTVHRLVQPFADPRVGAVSGNTKVANRQGLVGAWQHIEYVVGFNLDRRLYDVAECMPTVPGAIGGFRREALERVGGVPDDTLAEDTDLTMALCRDEWRVVYQEDAIAWTEAPASFGALWKQRYRWCYGTLQAMWKHRNAVVQVGAAGKLGRRGLGYLLVLQVLLPLFAPIVDLFALYGIFFLQSWRVLLVWCAFLLVQYLMALFAFGLDRESPRVLWSLPLQQFVYRQFMYLVVIQSVFTALAGIHLRWHRMERYGSLGERGLSAR